MSSIISIQPEAELPPAPRASAGCAPLRRANSVRRTSTVEASWPTGRAGAMAFDGRARDILTTEQAGEPRMLQLDRVDATIAPDRSIAAIASQPHRPGIGRLVGARGGGYLRRALDESLPEERDAGSPLYLLLDDFAGVSLIAGWAWRHWLPDSQTGGGHGLPPAKMAERLAKMEDICTGFASGSTALSDSDGSRQNFAPVDPLPNPADPMGWHPLATDDGVTMRRSRRIDVWRKDDGTVCIDAMFQDSASVPGGGRVAVHEYTLTAQADAWTQRLTGVQAQPRILPYPECPGATRHLDLMLGAPLRELRLAVLDRLPRTLGCTHLNDALRSLAEVPLLLKHLDQ